MGVGRGYHTREVETLGGPLLDTDANRAIFEEGLDLLLKCFNEDSFHHKGRYFHAPPPVPYRGYDLEEITMVPRPKHLPVEIFMPIASGRTIDLMAQKGLKAMVTLNGEKILDDVIRAYHAACAKHGQNKKLGRYLMLQDATGNVYTYSNLGSIPRKYPVPKRVKVTAKQITAEDRTRLKGDMTTILSKTPFNGDRFIAEVRRAMSGRRVSA